jgi:GT2 family glycosyltransferase
VCSSTAAIEVVVVDNASTDRTTDVVRQFSGVRLLEMEKNLGFGQANNRGLRLALEEGTGHVLLLNQDAAVHPGTIGALAEVSRRHPGYGIVSPLQYDGVGDKLDSRFRRFIANNYPEDFVRQAETEPSALPEILPVRFVNAAAWLVSRECLLKTGLFHPLFHHYGEDNNYCSRAAYHGFRTGITPAASVCHDREQAHEPARNLSREVRVVPLYILLDLRKAAALAYVLAWWKLLGYIWKAIKKGLPDIRRSALEKLGWSATHLRLILRTRREMKRPFAESPLFASPLETP